MLVAMLGIEAFAEVRFSAIAQSKLTKFEKTEIEKNKKQKICYFSELPLFTSSIRFLLLIH